MGDFLSKKTNSQATTNQQVGVQGGGAGLSGTIKGSQAAQNATATGNITAASGGSVNIISSDLAALQSNQAIATEATNAGLQTSIASLDALQQTQNNAAALIAQVQSGANSVALQATPVSAGDVALATFAAFKPLLIGAGIIAAIIVFVILTKKTIIK